MGSGQAQKGRFLPRGLHCAASAVLQGWLAQGAQLLARRAESHPSLSPSPSSEEGD